MYKGAISRRRLLALGAGLGGLLFLGGVAVSGARGTGLGQSERVLVDVLAGTLFPGNPGPSGDQVGAAEFVSKYLTEDCHAGQARIFRALFFGMQWGALASFGVPFTSLSASRRTAYLESWDRATGPSSAAFSGVKYVLSMAYLSHPEVRALAGIQKLCEPPA